MMKFEEVVFGICPGAGGYDAIAFLINVEKVEQIELPKYNAVLRVFDKDNNFTVFEVGI